MKDLLATSVILTLLINPSGDVNAQVIEGSIAEMTVMLKDYHNPADQLITGNKCDFNVFYASDYCDPRFLIEVGSIRTGPNNISEYRTLATKFSPKYKNAKSIHSVFFFKQLLDTFPERLRFNITIVDVDSGNSYQKIQEFIHELRPEADVTYAERLRRTAAVTLEVKITCGPRLYGSRCDRLCIPLEGVWECDPTTGERRCLIACENGKCAPDKAGVICVCEEGWQGPYCNVSNNMTTFALENATTMYLDDAIQGNTLSVFTIVLLSVGIPLTLILISVTIGLSCCFSTRQAKRRNSPSVLPAKDNPHYIESPPIFGQVMTQNNTTNWEPLPMRTTNSSAPVLSMTAEGSWNFISPGSQMRPSVLFRPNHTPSTVQPFNCDSVYEDVKDGDDGYEPINQSSTFEK
uniref:EGF-like domain-containing protein n=2 Tax=Schistocephalus solidus TaxID=70667 RepID=A0A0V0J936_SCHSO